MTIRHIRIFLSVCENGCNTTKAARALHMTQPAISLAVRELEQHYGVALFDRMGRRLTITPAGRQFLEYASRICDLFDTMEQDIRDWDAFGPLRVGASITIGSQFLPGYVKAFYSRYPGTEVRVTVSPSDILEEKVLKSELDFALIEGLPHHPSLIKEPYLEDQLAVICSADEFPQDYTLSMDAFRKQKFLLREPGSGTREVFNRVMESAGISADPIWEATSTTALVNAVIHGLGIAVLPHRMIQSPLEQGLIHTLKVEGLDFRRRFYIIYHKEKYLTASANAFLDLCRNYESEDCSAGRGALQRCSQ